MLLWLELKKILLTPMIFVFLALCFSFNLLVVIPSSYDDYAYYVANASKITGYKLGAEFEEKIAGLEPGVARDYFEADTKGKTDVFGEYDTAYIAETYIGKLGLSGYIAEMMRNKYAALQNAVDYKAASNESITLYFASATPDKHFGLHGTTLKFLFLECGLFIALIVLFSLGYEQSNRTSHTVYATKTGRNIVRYKLLASLSAGLLAYVLLTVLTLTVYFALNDYGNIWGSSVSSSFNYLDDVLTGPRPFVTWQSYTVLTYLLAVLGISALLTLCFGLVAFVIGTWIKNSYILTYGQWVTAMIILMYTLAFGVSMLTFILSRFSRNLITLVMKLIPVFTVMVFLCNLVFNDLFSMLYNTLYQILRVFGTEAHVCGVITILGLTAALFITHREKQVDVM